MFEPPPPGFHRQHRFSWIFHALSVVRSAVIPAILFLVFAQGWPLGWLAAFLALPAVAVGLAKHLTVAYAPLEGELVVREGILHRKERRIRHSRIHNLDEVQGLAHRLVGAVAVRIETASGGKPEAVLHLTPEASAELRAGIFAERDAAEGAGATPSEAPLVEIPSRDLVRLGLIQNRGFVVLAAVLGLFTQGWWEFDFIPWDRIEETAPEVLERGVEFLDVPIVGVVAAALGLIVVAYVLLAALSIALAVVRFSGFTLRRSGDDLTARYGLLARVHVTVPRRRIQRVRVDEGVLHRLFRRLSVRLDTAGGQAGGELQGNPWEWGEGDSTAQGKQWLAPVTGVQRLTPLVCAALPEASSQPLLELPAPDDLPLAKPALEAGGWRPVEWRAVGRLFKRSFLAVLLLTLALVWWTPWVALLPVFAIPLLWWTCRRTIAARFYWATDDALWWRSGWPGRELVVVPFDKIQSVRVAQTPFDRRHDMGRLIVDTAGSGLWHAALIKYLDMGDAERLGERLAREAGRRDFVWS